MRFDEFKMTKKKNILDNIVNMVSASNDAYTEIFIATADGNFGMFYVPHGNQRAEGRTQLSFDSLTLQDYLSRTQHYVATQKADYASRNPAEK